MVYKTRHVYLDFFLQFCNTSLLLRNFLFETFNFIRHFQFICKYCSFQVCPKKYKSCDTILVKHDPTAFYCVIIGTHNSSYPRIRNSLYSTSLLISFPISKSYRFLGHIFMCQPLVKQIPQNLPSIILNFIFLNYFTGSSEGTFVTFPNTDSTYFYKTRKFYCKANWVRQI